MSTSTRLFDTPSLSPLRDEGLFHYSSPLPSLSSLSLSSPAAAASNDSPRANSSSPFSSPSNKYSKSPNNPVTSSPYRAPDEDEEDKENKTDNTKGNPLRIPTIHQFNMKSPNRFAAPDDDDFDNFPEGEESLEASLDMHGSFLPPDESFSTDNNEYEPEYNKYNTTDHESTKDAIKECLQPFPFNYQTYEAYLKSPLRSPARQEPPSQWDEDDSQPQFYTRPSPSRYARQSPFAGPSPSRYPGPSPSYFHYPSPSLYDLPTPPRASPSRYPGPSPSRYAVSPDLHYLLGDLSITSPSHTTTKSQQEAQAAKNSPGVAAYLALANAARQVTAKELAHQEEEYILSVEQNKLKKQQEAAKRETQLRAAEANKKEQYRKEIEQINKDEQDRIEREAREIRERAEREERERLEKRRRELEAEQKAREEAERKRLEELEKIRKAEEEKKRREEAERKRLEEEERRLREEIERKKREEEERLRKEEEEALRKKKEEEERERKRQEDEERARKAKEEEEQRAREAEEAERKRGEEARAAPPESSTTPFAVATNPVVPTEPVAGPSQPPVASESQEEKQRRKEAKKYISPAAVAEYRALIEKYKSVLERVLRLEADPAFKEWKRKFTMDINLKVSQLCADMLVVRDRTGELTITLREATVRGDDVLLFCVNLLSSKILRQSTLVQLAQSAFPVGYMAVDLMQKFPVLTDVLAAKFFENCPYTIPRYFEKKPGQSEFAYRKKMGYIQIEDNPPRLEDDAAYYTRMEGTVRLYATIIQTPPQAGTNPYGVAHGWKWLARIANLPPVDITATILRVFLEIAGYEILRVYKNQFHKLLIYFLTILVPNCPKEARPSDHDRLLKYLQTYARTRRLDPPVGRDLDG